MFGFPSGKEQRGPGLPFLFSIPGFEAKREAGPDPARADDRQTLAAATGPQIRVSIVIILIFALATGLIIPYASNPGASLPGFVPSYQTAVCLLYALSYVHLVAQALQTGSTAVLHVAAGCLFSALILLVQMFSFPIWGPVQLVGSTPDTTSWLWTFWHLGPTFSTVTYVTARARERTGAAAGAGAGGQDASFTKALMMNTGLVLFAVAAVTAVSTWGLPWLPVIVNGDDYHALTTSGVGPFVLLATLVSLGLLIARTRCSTAIELWLAIALELLIMDDVLTLFGASRLSWGWYAGRAEAAASAAILLCLCLSELRRQIEDVLTRAATLANHQKVLSREIRKQSEANTTLSLLARQDGLTLLANRRCFDEALSLEWRRARRDHQPLAVLMIDVDRFKLYNDQLGHQAGDECLRKVAGLIQGVCNRAGDLAARYGGEEFVLLAQTDEHGALVIAEALRASIHACRIPHPGSPSGHLTVSIGLASFIPACDDDNVDALVAAADQALYRAKSSGRDRVVTMNERDMAAHELTRPLNEDDLRRALERDEFQLMYQPQVNVTSGAVVQFEALLRWPHPRRGLIMPDDFIPLAEKCRLIIQIGTWVLRRACLEAAGWPARVRVGVNISMTQLGDPGFTALVESILTETGLSGDRLEIEITETAAAGDLDAVRQILLRLRAFGISIALDDFGCGYSSLALARRLPVNHIKIDRSFVRQIDRDEQSALMIRAIRQMAESLGMRVTAEGVETETELRRLMQENIDTVQGYVFGKPAPADDVPAIVARLGEARAPLIALS